MQANSALTYAARGDIVSTNAESILAEIFRQMKSSSGWTVFEMDLRGTKMIDSVGLNLLISVIRSAKEKGASIRIRVGSSSLRRIMAFTRIDQHADVVEG